MKFHPGDKFVVLPYEDDCFTTLDFAGEIGVIIRRTYNGPLPEGFREFEWYLTTITIDGMSFLGIAPHPALKRVFDTDFLQGRKLWEFCLKYPDLVKDERIIAQIVKGANS